MIYKPDISKVAVLGGGPAGSFFAIFILQMAKKIAIPIEVLIIDRKNFRFAGPKGCNMCAGTIGTRLTNRLHDLGIPLTTKVIKHDIQGYTFHTRDDWVDLKKGEEARIYGVFRGGGPIQSPNLFLEQAISFDQFILDHALKEGAIFEEGEITRIKLSEDSKPRIWFRAKGSRREQDYESDLLAGAFGVNSTLLKKFGFGYQPPKTWHTCQSEIKLGREYIKGKFRDMIHIFPIYTQNIHYIAITPKGEYITVSAIGPYIKIRTLEQTLKDSKIKQFLPRTWQITCHCHPQIPITPAKIPFTNRFVIIGDASYSRYLKNGIESAFDTAYFAAETIFKAGISRKAFKKYFDKRSRKKFVWDNIHGKILFRLYQYFFTRPLFAQPLMDLLRREQKGGKNDEQPFSRILWDMFTGEVAYKRIARKAFSLSLLVRLFSSIRKYWRETRNSKLE
jgi:flavin-dependent dehydrogenase